MISKKERMAHSNWVDELTALRSKRMKKKKEKDERNGKEYSFFSTLLPNENIR